MSDPMKQAWSNVEQGLSTLGQMVKDHYRGVDGGEPDVDATASPAITTPAPSSGVRSNGSWQPSATSVNGQPTWLATTTSRRRPGRRRRH